MAGQLCGLKLNFGKAMPLLNCFDSIACAVFSGGGVTKGAGAMSQDQEQARV
jgi:hypothetical protein